MIGKVSEEKKRVNESDSEESGGANSSDSEGEEFVGELPEVKKDSKAKARISVSAEVFGRYNIKESFTPTVVQKP